MSLQSAPDSLKVNCDDVRDMDVYQPDLNADAPWTTKNLGYLPVHQINGSPRSDHNKSSIDSQLFESWDSENGAQFNIHEKVNKDPFFQDFEC